jgi:hypothetical protein
MQSFIKHDYARLPNKKQVTVGYVTQLHATGGRFAGVGVHSHGPGTERAGPLCLRQNDHFEERWRSVLLPHLLHGVTSRRR